MPLKSCSDLVLDERSPSCSSQSSATETYSVPLGTSTEIDFKYDDEQVANILEKIPLPKQNGGNVTTVIGSNNTVGAKVNIGVDAETTTININHYHPKPDPDEVDDDEPKNNAPPYREQSKKTRNKLIRNIILLLTLVVMILFIWALLRSNSTNDGITQRPTTTSTTVTTTEIPNYGAYVPRHAWNARNGSSTPIRIPAAILLVIKHTGGSTCSNFGACSQRVKQIQLEHMEVLKYPDIGYNFLVGGDGLIYEGRGWNVQNEGRNDSMDLAFIGDFNEEVPTSLMLAEAHSFLLISYGRPLDYERYFEICHNQTEPTDSPGQHLFRAVVSGTPFKHYTSKICYRNTTEGVEIDYHCILG